MNTKKTVIRRKWCKLDAPKVKNVTFQIWISSCNISVPFDTPELTDLFRSYLHELSKCDNVRTHTYTDARHVKT